MLLLVSVLGVLLINLIVQTRTSLVAFIILMLGTIDIGGTRAYQLPTCTVSRAMLRHYLVPLGRAALAPYVSQLELATVLLDLRVPLLVV